MANGSKDGNIHHKFNFPISIVRYNEILGKNLFFDVVEFGGFIVDSEEQLICSLFVILNKIKPNIIWGFNNKGFDMKVIMECVMENEK